MTTDRFTPSFTWRTPTKIVFGMDSLSRLPDEAREVAGGGDGASVFLVTGRSFLRSRGVLGAVLDGLAGFRVTLWERADPFPSPSDADEAAAACRAAGADAAIAIGGGSALDLAKAAAILSVHDGESRDYAAGGGRAFERRGPPLIAVPTTSGSSSEVTAGAALWDWSASKSFGLSSPMMFPSVAIVDPRLAMAMPQTLAANTGMDAFTSAFESYWNVDANPISDALALSAIRAYSRDLTRSAIQGDAESRSACALAATVSGAGYANVSPNACHAVGSALTLGWRVEHGQSVAITLVPFLRRAAAAIAHKMPPLLSALEVADAESACAKIDRLIRAVGLETRLSGLGLDESDLPRIVETARWERIAQHPNPPTRAELGEMLRGIL